jgi:hypothetical protein
MAGRKQHAFHVEDEFEEEECGGEEGAEGEEEYVDEEEGAEDEESGAGENAAEEDDRIQMASQQRPTAAMLAEAAAAKRTMFACVLDMSLWKTSWTIVVRQPHMCLYKKVTAPNGANVLENAGTVKYCAATKKTESTGKSTTVINIWVNKGNVGTRYGLSRKMFMANEVRDPGARITAGKYKNAPDAVSILQ